MLPLTLNLTGKIGQIIYNVDPMDLFILLYISHFISNLQRNKWIVKNFIRNFHLNFNPKLCP